jgi:hypothetical protein
MQISNWWIIQGKISQLTRMFYDLSVVSYESKLTTSDTLSNLWRTLYEEENWQTWKLTELDLPRPGLWAQHISQLELTKSHIHYKMTSCYGIGCNRMRKTQGPQSAVT